MPIERKKAHQPDREKYAYIYAKTREDKKKWQKMADDAGFSLSTFLQGLIDDGLAYREGAISKEELIRQIKELSARNQELNEDLTNARLRIKQLTEDARKENSEDWLDERFRGTRGFDIALIKILKDKKNLQKFDILDKLNIDPQNLEEIESVERQLEILETYGIIQRTIRGWKWL